MVPSLLTGQSYDVAKETSWTWFPSDSLFWENPDPLINIFVSPHKLPYGGVIENTSAPNEHLVNKHWTKNTQRNDDPKIGDLRPWFKTLRLQDCIVPRNTFNFSVINVINYYQWRLPIHTILKYMYRYLLSVFWNTDLPVYTYSTKIILGGRTGSVYSRNSCIKKWDSIFNLLNFFYPSSRKHK